MKLGDISDHNRRLEVTVLEVVFTCIGLTGR